MRFDFNKFEQELEKSNKLEENSNDLNRTNKIFSIIWNQEEEVRNIDFDSFTLYDAYLALRIQEDRYDLETDEDDADTDNYVYTSEHPFYHVDRMNSIFNNLATAQTNQSKKSKYKFI